MMYGNRYSKKYVHFANVNFFVEWETTWQLH